MRLVLVNTSGRKRFACALPDEAIVIDGDVDRLQQIFSNLVGNAFKYSAPDGLVRVMLERRGRSAIVAVQDQGEGIAREDLPRIFDLFQRMTKTGSGLGVGLAVVRALVDAHHGTIAAASEGRGRGTTFTVSLPTSD